MIATIARIVLGALLLFTGSAHFFARTTFYAQIPPWLPVDPDIVIIASGVVELALGTAVLLWTSRRVAVGWAVAALFVAVFPGNVSQFITHTPAFGLDTDTSRGIRLLFQPLLIVWALWCTGAWSAWRARRSSASS